MRPRLILVLAGLLVAVCWGCTDRAAKLPSYDHIPAFAMTDSEGRRFTSQGMAGSVWIVDFIYTNCPAECPRMSSQMHKVEQQFNGKSDVRFLSISVDPERDTPRVLHDFAQRWGGPNSQWTFITGTPETVHLLAYTTFHVGDVINKIEHSTKFALVDKAGLIRGYYSSFDPDDLRQMAADAELLRHSS